MRDKSLLMQLLNAQEERANYRRALQRVVGQGLALVIPHCRLGQVLAQTAEGALVVRKVALMFGDRTSELWLASVGAQVFYSLAEAGQPFSLGGLVQMQNASRELWVEVANLLPQIVTEAVSETEQQTEYIKQAITKLAQEATK